MSRIFRRLTLVLLCFFSIQFGVRAESEPVAGLSLDGQASDASFRLLIADSSSPESSLNRIGLNSTVSITLEINLPAADVGKEIDVYFIASIGSNAFMLSESNGLLIWNGQLASLEAFRSGLLAFDSALTIDVYSGPIDVLGEISFYVAYTTDNLDTLIYSSESIDLVVYNSADFDLVASDWVMTEEETILNSPAFIIDSPNMDVDNDGYTDILYGGPLYRASTPDGWVDEVVPIRWLRNTGSGTFEFGNQSVFPENLAFNHVHDWRIADFNSDGFTDVVIGNGGLDIPPYPGERNLLLFNNGDSTFTDVGIGEFNTFDFPGFTHSVAVGDINGDALIDIVTADVVTNDHPNDGRELLDQNIRILINSGGTNFTRDITALDIDGERTSVTDVELIDLDNDGSLDLLFGSSCDETEVSLIYWNDGSGYFNSLPPTELPNTYRDGALLSNVLAFAGLDLNGDSHQDLIIAKNKCYQENAVQFLENNGDRTFTDVSEDYIPENISGGEAGTTSPFYFQVHDFNLDGINDIMLGYNGGGNPIPEDSYIWLGTSAGRFENFEAKDLQGSPFLIQAHSWVIDVDNDGDLDWIQRGNIVTERHSETYLEVENKMSWRILFNQVIP